MTSSTKEKTNIRKADMSGLAQLLQSAAGQSATNEASPAPAAPQAAAAQQQADADLNAAVTFRQKLESLQPLLKSLLPPGRNSDAWAQRARSMVLLALQEDPNLVYCDNRSLALAIAKCIAYGLEPGDELRECAIRARQDEKGCWRAVFFLRSKGLVKTLMRTGKVAKVEWDVVRQGDEFEAVMGTEAKIRHVKPLFKEELGDVVGAYAIVTFTDGTQQIYVERKDVLDREHRQYSDTPEYWDQFPRDAYGGAALRNLWKQLPSEVVDPTLIALSEDEPVEAAAAAGSQLALSHHNSMTPSVTGASASSPASLSAEVISAEDDDAAPF